MKKIISICLCLIFTFSMSTDVLAASNQKAIVTTENTTIFKTASIKSEKLATVKQGYSFNAIGSTKSFWKLEYKKKNDNKIYTGYILKKDTKETVPTSKSSSDKSSSNWAKTYYDFFSNDFSIGKIPMFQNEKRWIHNNDSTILVLADVYFAQIKGYDHPVLLLGECTIDDSFYWMLPYIIKNGKITNFNQEEYREIITNNDDGFPEINGKVLAKFDLKGYDLNGKSNDKLLNESMQNVLKWLENQK